MDTTAPFSREKAELDALLASGIFSRAPNLATLLKWICEKYFSGTAAEIKEYNIAVEALNRPPEFDQKRDSIVRVEAHRLRKRLREYYGGPGADHEIHIDIPSGQYTPRFVFTAKEHLPATVDPAPLQSTGTALMPVMDSEEERPPAYLPPASPPQRSGSRWVWAAGIGVLLLAAMFLVAESGTWRQPQVRIVESPVPANPADEIRIMCGVESGSYVDAFEHSWLSDRYFSGGYVTQSARVHPIPGTRDQRLFKSRREGGFRYDIPLKQRTYELRLYFAETVYGENNVAGGGETSRMFSIIANGKTLIDQFDVIADAGSAVADIKVFKDIQPAADGKLHLEFGPETNAAFLNALELLPSPPGRIRPVRIIARDRGLKDGENRYWDPDRYALGGQLIPRPESNVKDNDPELFRGERFGNIVYSIPVAAEGRYGANLYFAENWFGPGMPGGGGVGDRLFDILINGVAVRRRFDIFREAGGVNLSTVLSLHGIEPTHQGKVVISLIPDRNYACINGLEVFDESK